MRKTYALSLIHIYRIILASERDLDRITVEVELLEKYFADSLPQLDAIRKKIQASIMGIIGSRVEIRIVEPNKIPRSEGKAKRVFDYRKI